jgi:D-tyrosyl-tRNA(Tyr) deacylase
VKVVVQRVSEASLAVDGVERATVASDRGGLVVLVGLEETDTATDRAWMADKVVNLRIFPDDEGKMNRSVLEVGGSVMMVPNFTVAGSAQRGRRPSFDRAMKPERSETEFRLLVEETARLCPRVSAGVFRAHMKVSLVNDGPVTILLDSRT